VAQEPLESAVLSPLQNGSLPFAVIFLFYCAPPCTLAHITGVSSTSLLPLRYNVMTSLCGPFVGRSSPGAGTSTRIPFYLLVGDVVAH